MIKRPQNLKSLTTANFHLNLRFLTSLMRRQGKESRKNMMRKWNNSILNMKSRNKRKEESRKRAKKLIKNLKKRSKKSK